MSTAAQRLEKAKAAVADFEPEVLMVRFAELATPSLCEHAKAYSEVADEICTTALAEHDLGAINIAKIKLGDICHRRLDKLPRDHPRDDAALVEGGHACVFSVYREAYDRLLEAEIVMFPQRLLEVRETQASYETGRDNTKGLLLGERLLDPEFG